MYVLVLCGKWRDLVTFNTKLGDQRSERPINTEESSTSCEQVAFSFLFRLHLRIKYTRRVSKWTFKMQWKVSNKNKLFVLRLLAFTSRIADSQLCAITSTDVRLVENVVSITAIINARKIMVWRCEGITIAKRVLLGSILNIMRVQTSFNCLRVLADSGILPT